jgi:hypothetical protein
VVEELCLCRAVDTTLDTTAPPSQLLSQTKTKQGSRERCDATPLACLLPLSFLTPSLHLSTHTYIRLTTGLTAAAAMVNSDEIACVSPLCNLGECHGREEGREGGRRGLCMYEEAAVWSEGRGEEGRTWSAMGRGHGGRLVLLLSCMHAAGGR